MQYNYVHKLKLNNSHKSKKKKTNFILEQEKHSDNSDYHFFDFKIGL